MGKSDIELSAGTSDRGDTLQASEKITLHDTTLDHTCTLGHTLGRQGGDHMLTLSLLLVATLVTPWKLCSMIFFDSLYTFGMLCKFTTIHFVTLRGILDSPQ